MRKPISLKKRSVIFFCLFLLLSAGITVDCSLRYPDCIDIFEGEFLTDDNTSSIILDIPASNEGVLLDDGTISGGSSILSGSFNAELKLFGIIPVRTIQVDVHPKTELVPCGNTIGIKIFTQGLVCVGTSEIKSTDGKITSPTLDFDIHEGDILLSANGTPLETTEQLASIVESSCGNIINFKIEHDKKQIMRKISPVKTQDGYKLGLWVRDSTAGIGTLTFYDNETKLFGALGHPIADSDTGALMPVSSGTILNASVFDVKKGSRGEPGELKGVFSNSDECLGYINKNTEQGIYGSITPHMLPETHSSIPVASGSQVKEGEATILSNVDGKNVQEFSIEIQKIMRYNANGTKDMVIKITDPALLEKTGGIVQGMSGSPIIQDGKLIGAVTHVFVNDPTRGYGIFIENMLSEAEKIK
ncbi:MAG: SpoIVB peptidase [Clostridia bacterium]|nr:SpoIVB peptidase [Clostridia bacterium]